MSNTQKINSALISVFHKDGLENIVNGLKKNNVKVYSTGGTYAFLEPFGLDLIRVEDITGYPSILGGRVKTLHPKVFGGILAKRNDDHLEQLSKFDIPPFDLVIVDLYPFEETVASTNDAEQIIEKIDIGGISLIRAAAKNYNDVVVIPSKNEYHHLADILDNGAETTIDERKTLAAKAFTISSTYDTHIASYMLESKGLNISHSLSTPLRYGENPHQKGFYFGNMEAMFHKLGGKDLSFNNLVDVDAAILLMKEFKNDPVTCCILKHTNACGVATRTTALEAWNDALAGDPTSAFGGILIFNSEVDLETALEIDKIFYEVLIAPSFSSEAQALLMKKKKRVLLKLNRYPEEQRQAKSILNGMIVQDLDQQIEGKDAFEVKTKIKPSDAEMEDLLFANKCAKHLKSNTIVLIKNKQLIGMGCGQTSRIDACKQAIEKAKKFNFDIHGSSMASDAFFPFPDCVEIAGNEGVKAVVQPGGSINDKLSIEKCNELRMSMVCTGVRHFKH